MTEEHIYTEIERLLKQGNIITTNDLVRLYRKESEELSRATINWRIYELVKKGVLQRVAQGKFQKGAKEKFKPSLSPVIHTANNYLRKHFAYLSYCLWDNEMLNAYHQHLPSARITFIDVEKDAMQPVYEFLKDKFKNLYLKFSKHAIHQPVLPQNDSLVIRQLITETPIQIIEDVPTATIEKIIVDAFVDTEFEYVQGYEFEIVARNIFDHLTVNQGKLFRYASRKGKTNEMRQFLEKNKLLLNIQNKSK